ncbi:MAG: sn-glycerol-3-phosphate ABC transporter ATP-binding protein UgpC [Pseudomonadota bacterium]
MASVDIENADKFYGTFQALYSVSVAIPDGEFVVLVGPSGCGKSTLLRMIAGLEKIDAGEIKIGGDVVNTMAPKDRDVAMVFQNYALYPHKTVRQNMAFSLRMRRVDASQIEPRVQQAAEILDLADYLDRYPRQLSGGQRQRVAMGRALVRQPQLFLFDEPLSNLDAKLRIQMRTEIKSIHQRVGTTAIYVTHDQVEAMTLADRIVVMNKGRIEQIGAPMKLYEHPANQFVAAFIGSPPMNLLAGKIAEADGRLALSTDRGERISAPDAAGSIKGDQVNYGIRPEHISIQPVGNGDPSSPATVKSVEPMGSETLVVAEFGGEEVRVLVRDGTSVAPGETIKLQPNLSHVHLFDPATGVTLADQGATAH